MKFARSAASLTALTATALAALAWPAEARTPRHHHEPVPISAMAPADRYFGPLKMSILGIDNAMRLVERRIHGGDLSDSTLSSLTFVKVAIRDCERQFPRDPWLSRAVFALHRISTEFAGRRARVLAKETATWLSSRYADSREAELLRGSVRDGARRMAGAPRSDS